MSYSILLKTQNFYDASFVRFLQIKRPEKVKYFQPTQQYRLFIFRRKNLQLFSYSFWNFFWLHSIVVCLMRTRVFTCSLWYRDVEKHRFFNSNKILEIWTATMELWSSRIQRILLHLVVGERPPCFGFVCWTNEKIKYYKAQIWRNFFVDDMMKNKWFIVAVQRILKMIILQSLKNPTWSLQYFLYKSLCIRD